MPEVRVLFPDRISTDTVKCCSTLTRHARRGDLTGLAFIGYVEQHGFIANACGDAFQNPALTLWMMRALDAKLALRLEGASM